MNSSFRQNLFYLTLILVFATVLSACGDDDVDDMLMNCPAPVDAFVLSNCLMDIPSVIMPLYLRPLTTPKLKSTMPAVTTSVE